MQAEDDRLSIVRALTVTDPSPDSESDDLVRYAAQVCNAPQALLALSGRNRFWFRSRLGIEASEVARFALPPDLEVIEDARLDGPGHPLLALSPGARFLAVAPLRAEQVDLGVLAVLDRRPRALAPHQADALRFAASQAVGILKLRRRVRLLEALLESSPDQFHAFDTRGRYLYVGERAARAMGLEASHMLGRTWQELGLEPDYQAQFYGLLRLALTTGRLIEDAREARTPAGPAHHEYALAPLRGQRGEIEGVAVTSRDVTARVTAENERRAALETAQRAVRQRDEVTAVVSHDLRNMLNVFRLGTSSLAAELPEDATAAHGLVSLLQAHAESMSRLLDDLVDVGSIGAGSLRIVRAGCDARVLTQDALRAVEPLARQRGIALEALLPAPGTPLHCDRRRILQVFANLLGNAIKFTPRGTVRVEVSLAERQIRFTVSDTGEGISPEHLPHLFERYWQAPEGQRSGAGLGLYIARGIVEAHGGRIWADSAKGKGAQVSFTLPRP
ncbi:MAG TPA: HAMP domain-containing sensor histidine kinase [Myxococcales bacterium]|nr:HAMP domain-containing sensor histidine kinase [Myxococcales bacterium]